MDKYLKMEADYHQVYEMNQRLVSEIELYKHRLGSTITEVDYLKAQRHEPVIIEHKRDSGKKSNRNTTLMLKHFTKKMQLRHDETLKRVLMRTWIDKFRSRTHRIATPGAVQEYLMNLIMDVRTVLNDEIWEIFIRSVDTANTRKTNSVI